MSRPSTFGTKDLTLIAADFAALPWPDHDARVLAEAYLRLEAELRAAHDAREAVEHREGVVEVYDWQGSYLGCMGVDTWEQLLASEAANGQPQPSE